LSGETGTRFAQRVIVERRNCPASSDSCIARPASLPSADANCENRLGISLIFSVVTWRAKPEKLVEHTIRLCALSFDLDQLIGCPHLRSFETKAASRSIARRTRGMKERHEDDWFRSS
jgi:hypothetical protein